MSILVIAEHDNKKLHSVTLNTLTAALQLGSEVSICVVGHQCAGVAEQAAGLAGVKAVVLADHEVYQHQLAENVSGLIVSLSADYTAILAPATTFGKNILPRVAALLDTTQISDVTQIVSPDVFVHPIYAGNALETVRVLDDKKILTIRTTAFNALSQSQSPCAVIAVNTIIQTDKTQFLKHELTQSERPDLSSAKIVVSGGRGLQSAEKFKLVEELADVLGAAVGASRAAVDAGFVPNDYQVGQTGKVVAPDLYIAVGISGAVQHLAGMKDAKVIVAINKDEDAPIFQVATYGLVGDLFTVVPEFIDLLKKKLK